jgi:cystathionine beta-lyase
MKFDFDKPTERRNTGSVKWDIPENELPMWIADMDFETAPAVREAIEETAKRGIFGYSTLPDEYFAAASDFWHSRYGYRFDPSWMVFVNGVVGAISSMVRKLTTPGENVLVQPPVYNIFYNSILNNGRNVITNPLIYENGEYRMDFSDLEEKLACPQTSLMILCNPHNPVGKIWDRETLARVGELCKKHSVTVISDEIHCSLTAPGHSYVPFASVSDVCRDISVTCVAASKTFNLAGLQAAIAIAKDPHLRHKVWRGINTDEVGEPNVFAVSACVAAYRHGGEWLDAVREYLFENRRYAEAFIKENMPRLAVTPADATYLLWVNVSAYTENSEDFCRELRQKTGLYISDGAEYGIGGERFVRINLATQRKNVEDGMARLLAFIKGKEAGLCE